MCQILSHEKDCEQTKEFYTVQTTKNTAYLDDLIQSEMRICNKRDLMWP